MEEILNQTGVAVGAVDVAVECLGSHEVERIGTEFVIGNFHIEVADTIAYRAKVHHGLIFDELGTSDAVGCVPNMVNLPFDSELVVPRDSGGSVANELSVDVGGFGHPPVESVLFDAVGARITGGVGVDDTRGVNCYNTIVRET